MNPKAMPRHQLLGHIDMDTREWSDGVLTHSARTVVKELQGKIVRASLTFFPLFTNLCGNHHTFEYSISFI